MSKKNNPSPLKRYETNPIITPEDMPVECSSVFNAGAVIYNGKVLLVLRVEDFARRNHFYTATSDDGINFTINPQEINYPARPLEEKHGLNRFDMRITHFEDGTYYGYHCIWLGDYGSTVGLCQTNDFINFEAIGGPSVPSNSNAVLFPEKINGRYCRFERPDGTRSKIWVSYSPDLAYWGDSAPLEIPFAMWNHGKIGASTVPIRTKHGWLAIYHAVANPPPAGNYFLGVMLLDIDDPTKIIACPKRYILRPRMNYECVGQVPNVVFTSGAVIMPDGTMNVYYGGGDTVICLAQSSVDELIKFCLKDE